MDPTIVVAIIGGIATVAAAYIGRSAGARRGRREAAAEIMDAPRRYVERLDELIMAGARGDSREAVVNARAIVSVRNDVRGSMIKISDRLNSEIDTLARQQQEAVAPEALIETMQVLAKKWPAKRDEIEIELRKVLAELGLSGGIPKHDMRGNWRAPPSAPPASPPPPTPPPPSSPPPSPAGAGVGR